ncbi:MAG: RsmE family RNA methyltransferase [Bacteriovorax sp.]|nr:RsmE family RNA methyltransferase [Bacteriovorax sp.]
MRAIFYPFSRENALKSILVTDESAKHLHVVRIKAEEEILVLNGSGLKALTRVGAISKNQIELIVDSIEESKDSHEISLAIANPKKDAFEDILKIAVELGVRNIYPLTSEFSQYDYLASDRVQRILESALIQSNNPFLPIVHPQVNLNIFLDKWNSPLFFFNSKPNNCGKVEKISGVRAILIGPEGGFSLREEASILAKSNVFSIHLPTPILRAPTAVASSMGYLLSPS